MMQLVMVTVTKKLFDKTNNNVFSHIKTSLMEKFFYFFSYSVFTVISV